MTLKRYTARGSTLIGIYQPIYATMKHSTLLFADSMQTKIRYMIE